MTMAPTLRKLMLTVSLTVFVGWSGAVTSFLALAIVGVTTQDAQIMRAAYLAMELTAWWVIVPLSFASPLSGIVQSLGTTWGLFQHYWVLIKFLMTIPCTLVLLLHMQPISRLGRLPAETTCSGSDLSRLRIQLVADAGDAVLVLLVATTLSVYKPQGLTRYGARNLQAHRHET